MSKKDVIETNKLYVGTGGTIDGLYIGSPTDESRYAVLTDDNAQKTVIYDKVEYEFVVDDIANTVPANGGTYNVTASISKKTHGDGTVESPLPFSPTSFTIPANTGASYSSSVTITQSGSVLVDVCDFTVEADYVTSLSLILNTPAVIPASGGSVNSTTYTLVANYKSGRVVSNVSTATLEWTGVTAGSKGTTISNQTDAGTLRAQATFGGKTTTATVTVEQQANYVTAVVASGSSSTTHFKYNNIGPAATSANITGQGGGEYTFTSGSKLKDSSASPSFGGTATYTRNGFTLASSQNGFTAVNATSGKLTATSLGTTISNARTSANVSGKLTITYTHASAYSAGGTVTSPAFTSTATCTQTGNYVTAITVSTSPAVSYSEFHASGGTQNDAGTNGVITYKFTTAQETTTAPAGGTLTTTPSYAMTNGGGFYLTNTTAGTVSADTRGTTSGATRTSNTITKTVNYSFAHSSTYSAGGTKTASATATGTATQGENVRTSTNYSANTYTGSVTIGSGLHASGGSATVTYNAWHTAYDLYTSGAYNNSHTVYDPCNVTITTNGNSRFSGSGTKTTASSTNSTFTLSHSTMGTTATTDNVTVTLYNTTYSATSGVKTASTSVTNAITNTNYSANTYTGSVTIGSGLHASGGSATVTYNAWHSAYDLYTSGAYNNSHTVYDPCNVTITTNGNSRFSGSGTKTTASSTNSTFTLSHTTMGSAVTTDNVTLTLYNTTYSATSGVKTASSSVTNTLTYKYPAITSISYPAHDATSGTVTPTIKGSCYPTYTSTVTGAQVTNITLTVTSASMTAGNGATINTSTGVITWAANTTTSLDSPAPARTSNTATLNVSFGSTYSNLTASGTATATQNADAISSTVISNLSANTYTASTSPAPAGQSTFTLSGGKATVTYVSGAKFYPTATLSSSYRTSSSSRKITFSSTDMTSATTNVTCTVPSLTYSHIAAGSYTITSTYSGVSKTITIYQAANGVTGITANNTISYAQIPASGGTVNPTVSTAYTLHYASTYTTQGSSVTTYGAVSSTTTYSMTDGNGFSLKSTSTGQVSATTKGTTVTGATTSNTVTMTVNYTWTPAASYAFGFTEQTCTGTKTTNVTQAANAVTATEYSTPTITSPTAGASIGTIPAAGGTVTPTKTASQTITYTFTSTATSSKTNSTFTWTSVMTNGNGFYLTNATNGTVSAATKGTTTSNATTSNTATLYAWANGKTGSTTYKAVQAKNEITGYTAYETPYGGTFSASLIPASGGTSNVTSNTSGVKQKRKAVYSSTATAATATEFTPTSITTGVTGNGSVASKGTTVSNETTAKTLTCWYAANSVTASSTVYALQEANYVTVVQASGRTSGSYSHFSYANIAAKTTTASPSLSGTAVYTFTSGSKETSNSTTPFGGTATYTRSNYTLAASQNGFTAVNASTGVLTATARGTTIGNNRTSANVSGDLVVTYTHGASYSNGGTVTSSAYTSTATCTQTGNYVTGITLTTNPAVTYAVIPAAGGTATDSGSNGVLRYSFTSGSYTATKPSTTYGALTSAATYTMESGNGFSLTNATNGTVSATTKGTTVSNVTSSETVTKSITYTWTPTASYNAAGTITQTGSATGKATQAANAVASYVGYTTPSGYTFSGTQVPAAGGTSTVTSTGTLSQKAYPVYNSTATGSSLVNVTGTVTTGVTGNGAIASKGTTVSNVTTNAKTVTCWYAANGVTATSSLNISQAANYVVTVQASGTTSGSYSHFSYANIAAKATSASPTLAGTAVYTFSSGSKETSNSTTPFGGTATYTRSNYTLASSQNGFTAVNASTGVLTATARGTTIGNARTSANVSGNLVVSYTHGSSYSAGGTVTSSAYTSTATCTQEGNYVTGLTITSTPTISILIPASGGTKTDSGSAYISGTLLYYFSSGVGTPTTPSSTYGALTTAATYTMTNGNNFFLTDSTNGTVSAVTKGTTVTGETSSNTITKTVTFTWTPTSSYNAAGTITATKSKTGNAVQEANAITSTTWGNVTITSPTGASLGEIPAGGGSKTPTKTATQSGTNHYTSGAEAATSNNSFTWSVAFTDSGNYTLKSSSTGEISASTRGTTTGNTTTSNTATITCTGAGSKIATATYYVTQQANAVTSTTWGNVSITSPTGASLGEIPASGGSKTPTKTATQSGTNYYTSGANAATSNNSFTWSVAFTNSGNYTLKSSSTGEISASTRGTTSGATTTSNTATITCTGAGSKTATATYYVTQQANSYTDTWNNPVISSPTAGASLGEIPAAGGSKTPTLTATQSGTRTWTSTSTSAITNTNFTWVVTFTNSGNYTLKSSTTGEISASTRGTTSGATTTSNTATAKCTGSGSKSASTTYYVTQAANTYTDSWNNPVITSPNGASIGEIAASGGSKTPTLTATQSGTRTYTSTATSAITNTNFTWSVAFTNSGNFTLKSATTGQISATTKGTDVSNTTTSNTATATCTGSGSKTATATYYVTQQANYIVTVTPKATASGNGKHFFYNNIAASATTAAVTKSGNCDLTYTSGAVNSSVGSYATSSYTRTYTLAASQNGFTAVNASTGALTATARGTTIGNARTSANVTSVLTITITHNSAYSGGGTVTGSMTSVNTCTQEGNYVTGLTVVTNPTVAYPLIPASGGTVAETGDNGTVKFAYSSKSTGTTIPSSTYGTLTYPKSYSIQQEGYNDIFLQNVSTGAVSGATREGITGSTRASSVITKTVTYTWTPTASYNAAGTKTVTGTGTGTASQQANTYTEIWNYPSLNLVNYKLGSTFAASGGSATLSLSTVKTNFTQTGKRRYTSGFESNINNSGSGSEVSVRGTMDNGSGFVLVTSDTITVSAITKGTTVTGQTTSNTITIIAVGKDNKACTGSCYSVQAANAVTNTVYGDITVSQPASGSSLGQIAASGGTITPPVKGASQTITYTFTSTATSSRTNTTTFTWTATMTNARGFYLTNATNGTVSAVTKGTTVTGVTTSNTVTYKAVNGGKTGTTTYYVTQEANAVVGYFDYQAPSGVTFEAATVPASGGQPVITPNTSSVTTKAKPIYTSNSSGSSYTTLSNVTGVTTGVTGTLPTIPSKGLVYTSAVTNNVATVTCWYAAGGKTGATVNVTVKQARNRIASARLEQTDNTKPLYYFTGDVPAAGSYYTLPGVSNSHVVYVMDSGAEGTKSEILSVSPAAYEWTETVKYYSGSGAYDTYNGPNYETSYGNDKGTDISNRTLLNTVWQKTSSLIRYNSYGDVVFDNSSSPLVAEAAVYQEGNYVTAFTCSSGSFNVAFRGSGTSYRFRASGETKGDYYSADTPYFSYARFYFTSGKYTALQPSSTYGIMQTAITYTMENGNGFTFNPDTKLLTAESKGTVVSNITTSNTITKCAVATWIPTANYTPTNMPNGGLISATARSVTTAATQEANSATSTSGSTLYASGISGYNYMMTVSANTGDTVARAMPSAQTGNFRISFTGQCSTKKWTQYQQWTKYTSTATGYTLQPLEYSSTTNTVKDSYVALPTTILTTGNTAVESPVHGTNSWTRPYYRCKKNPTTAVRTHAFVGYILDPSDSGITAYTHPQLLIYQKAGTGNTSCTPQCTSNDAGATYSDGPCTCNSVACVQCTSDHYGPCTQCTCNAEYCDTQCDCNGVACSQCLSKAACTCDSESCSQCTCNTESCEGYCTCDSVTNTSCTCNSVGCTQCSCDTVACVQCTCDGQTCVVCTADGGCAPYCACDTVCTETWSSTYCNAHQTHGCNMYNCSVYDGPGTCSCNSVCPTNN